MVMRRSGSTSSKSSGPPRRTSTGPAPISTPSLSQAIPSSRTGGPRILNAAGSETGRAFATDNADDLFTPAIDLTFSHVICRETEEEATALRDRLMGDLADREAVDNLVNLQFVHAQSFPHDPLAQIKNLFAMGHGGFPLAGTPRQFADGILKLHETGFFGTALSSVDYVKESPYFRDTVLPLLAQEGIRQANAVLLSSG